MYKLAFITNIVPHYRETFYKKLLVNYDYLLISSQTNKDKGRPALSNKVIDNHFHVKEFEIYIFGIFFRYQIGALSITKNFDPDIVIVLGISSYVSNWLILIWGFLKKKKIIIWTSGWERVNSSSPLFFIKRALNKHYYKLANKILVYSTKGKKYLESFLNNMDIQICYNGIEIEDKKKNYNFIVNYSKKIKEEYGNKKIFLYVGGMLLEKKVDLLIKAFEKLYTDNSNFILLLIGDGPDLNYFMNLSQNSNIRFLGRKVNDVDYYFAACDYFVLPGLGGLALNEAMFWGKPCIVSKADGTEDDLVIDNFTGFRFKENDVVSLYQAMKKITSLSEENYVEFANRCKNIVLERSNVDMMVNIFNNAIWSMIEN